jgi:site-specific recombinase XerD
MDLNNLNIAEIEQLRGLLGLLSHTGGSGVTLGTFVEEYLKFIRLNRSESYYANHQISFSHLVEYFKAQRMMSMISFKDAEMFMTHLQKKVVKGYRVYYRNLKAAFNKAVEWGYIATNPFLKVKLAKQQKNQPAYLSEKELNTILDKIEIKAVRDVSALSFYTGCRLGEVVALKWKNVNIADGYLIIGDDEYMTKGRTQRRIPLCDEAEKIFKARIEEKEKGKVKIKEKVEVKNKATSVILPIRKKEMKGFVFEKGNGTPFSCNYISKRFKSACRLAGVSEKIHFHSLRHSFASNLAQREVSLYKIKELLGHSSITTTEIYAHLNIDGLRDAVNVLNNPPQNQHLGNGETRRRVVI